MGGGGGGARVSDFFFTKNPNQKKIFLFFARERGAGRGLSKRKFITKYPNLNYYFFIFFFWGGGCREGG